MIVLMSLGRFRARHASSRAGRGGDEPLQPVAIGCRERVHGRPAKCLWLAVIAARAETRAAA